MPVCWKCTSLRPDEDMKSIRLQVGSGVRNTSPPGIQAVLETLTEEGQVYYEARGVTDLPDNGSGRDYR